MVVSWPCTYMAVPCCFSSLTRARPTPEVPLFTGTSPEEGPSDTLAGRSVVPLSADGLEFALRAGSSVVTLPDGGSGVPFPVRLWGVPLPTTDRSDGPPPASRSGSPLPRKTPPSSVDSTLMVFL